MAKQTLLNGGKIVIDHFAIAGKFGGGFQDNGRINRLETFTEALRVLESEPNQKSLKDWNNTAESVKNELNNEFKKALGLDENNFKLKFEQYTGYSLIVNDITAQDRKKGEDDRQIHFSVNGLEFTFLFKDKQILTTDAKGAIKTFKTKSELREFITNQPGR